MTETYLQYQPLIKERARKFSRVFGIETDELEAIGNLAFCECFPYYDPEKGKFSTFLYTTLNFKFMDYARIRREQIAELDGMVEILIEWKQTRDEPKDTVDFWEMVNSLSLEAQTVIDLVLYPTPIEKKTRIMAKQRITQNLLSNFLHREGWRKCSIKKAFNEISLALR